jgi:hypothetical protein
LPFVDTQTKPASWAITGPKFERDIVPLRSIIRQGEENSFVTPLAARPFFSGHA